MSDIKISQLPEVSSLIPSDIGPVVASGVTSKITVQNLAGTLPTVSSSISASYAVTASYTVSSSYALSASFVQSASFATNASNSVSASYAATASSADNFLVRQDITGSNALFTGTITAQKLVVQVISSSVIYSSGSNKFGDELTDVQQFTGSVRITGSMIVNAPTLFNDQVLADNITGSLFGTASWARNAITASYVTGAIFNSTNPVLSASYALSASFAATTISASYALSSSYAVTASRSITASYAISSSYAEVAGFVTGSNVYGPYGSNSIISASFASSSAQAISSSYSVSSSYALSASYAVSASQSVSSSFALTASYLSGYIEPFPYTGSAQITGSLGVTGSISSTQGFSGSLFGTSSWAENAVTASFVTGSNVWGPFGSNSIISASYAITASYALNGGSGTSNPAVGFTQSLAATTWSFTHNLNTRIPIVQAFDTAYNQIIPNAIQTIDPSTVEIRFTYAQAGYAIASNGGSYTVSGSTSRLNQSVANVTWSFAHGLNSQYVNYEIYDSNNFVIIPAGIKAVDSNNAEIYFATATSGVAIAMFSGINGAPNAVTASYAFTASFVATASSAVSASFSSTASYISTASWAQNSISASFALTASYISPITSGYVVLTQVSQSLDYADDTAAAAGGVPLGGLYRNGNFILIRMT